VSSLLASGFVLAAATKSKGSNGIFLFLILGLAVLGYYFFLRPRTQRQRAAREALKKAAVGDEIATIGGLVGTIVAEEGDRVTVSTGNGTELVFLRQAIGRRIDPPAPSAPDEPDSGEFEGAPPGFEAPAAGDTAPTAEDPDKK
jgi:preprotein translocase subunit YajC